MNDDHKLHSKICGLLKEIRDKFNERLLFRGQGDAEWKIQSTLERAGFKDISLKDYYEEIDSLKPEINSLGHHFQRWMGRNGYLFDFSDYHEINRGFFPDIEYLSYLRHHGFPTPLIDVTQSEYVALYFACEELCEKKAKIFVFAEDFGNTAVGGEPELHQIGHYLESDRRHIAQQSEYFVTVQYRRFEGYSEWHFVPFESFRGEYFGTQNSDDVESCTKSFFEIEIAEHAKKEILAELARMNVNRYTLYLDEDSLVQKLKQDFLRRKRR